jgi:hypothetical protein
MLQKNMFPNLEHEPLLMIFDSRIQSILNLWRQKHPVYKF